MKSKSNNESNEDYIFFLCLIIGGFSCISYGQEIEHNPPRDFISSEPITIRLKIFDLDNYDVKCFYKFNDSEEFSVIELNKIGRRMFKIDIFPKENSNNIKYYFWIYKNNRFYKTLPETNPIGNPFSILNTQEALDYFTLLSPLLTKEKIGYRKDMIFVVKNNFPNAITFDSAILNDDEPLKIISKKKILLNMKSTFPIRQGKNRLLIKGRLSDGSIVKQNMIFHTKKLKKKRSVKKRNEMKINYNMFKSNKKIYTQNDSELLYSIKQEIETSGLFLESYGLYDNRGSKYTQPYSRFRLNVIDKQFRWKVNAGDIEENFSPLTINGKRVRGLYSEIDLLKFFKKQSMLSLRHIIGNTNKAIQISSGNISIGTYSQEVSGYQLKFSSMKLKSSLQYFKVYDKPNSLNSESKENIRPIENHILGAFFQIRPTPLSVLENEFVAAAYYLDNQASVMDVDELDLPESAKELINKYLPIKTSLTGGFSNRLTIQAPLNKTNIIKIGHDITYPNYYNVLNSFVESDNQEISLGLTQKLLNKTLVINTGFNNKRNNLLGTSSETSYDNSYRINSIYRTKKIGSLNATSMITRKTEAVTTGNEDLNNQLNYIMLSLSGIPLKSKLGKVRGNLSYSISDYLDYNIEDNNSYSNAFSADLMSSYKKYRVSLGINQSKTKSIALGTTRYLTMYSSVSRTLNQQFKFSTKLKLSLGNNDDDDDDNKIHSRKITNNWYFTYRKKKLGYFKQSEMRLGIEFIYMKDDENLGDETSNFIEAYSSFSMTNKF